MREITFVLFLAHAILSVWASGAGQGEQFVAPALFILYSFFRIRERER